MSLPDELAALLAQIDACETAAAGLVAGMTEDTVNRSPAGGGWSVAACLEHLALMNDFYLRGWPQSVQEAAARGRGPFNGLRPTKGNAIADVTPRARYAPDDILARYVASHRTYRELVRAAAEVDVNRVVRPNAIVRQVKMRLSTVLLIVPAHDRRHLWQAANVRRAVQGA
jgi:hypothetical protein